MKPLTKSFLIGALALVSALSLGQTTPKQVMANIQATQQSAFTSANAAGKAPDFAALELQTKQMATDAVKGVDPEKIEAKDTFDWAQVYSIAGMHSVVCSLTHRYLTTNPDKEAKFQAQILMMNSCNALHEGSMLESTLEEIKPNTTNESAELSSATVYQYAQTLVNTKGPKEALNVLQTVQKNLVFEDPAVLAAKALPVEKSRLAAKGDATPDADILKTLTARYVSMSDTIKLTFVDREAQILSDGGEPKQGLKLVDDYIATLDPKSPGLRNAKMIRTRLAIKGSLAPAVAFDRQYGDFKGLDSLKGKVVILDTFAHWCGPCKASFPDMRKMYDDLKDKGLEIVGVTAYYGFFGKEKQLDPATEYAKMADFRAQYNMNWPIVFGDKTNFENYGVSGIPTTFLIDRSGTVRSIHVGYSAESFKEFRAEVEKTVAEKP